MANYFCELPCVPAVTPTPPLPSPLSTVGALLDLTCPGQGAEVHCPAFFGLTKGTDSPHRPRPPAAPNSYSISTGSSCRLLSIPRVAGKWERSPADQNHFSPFPTQVPFTCLVCPLLLAPIPTPELDGRRQRGMKKKSLGPPYFSGHEVGGPSTQYFLQLQPFIRKPTHLCPFCLLLPPNPVDVPHLQTCS